MRCAGPTAARGGVLCALPALWVGLLYDQTALDAAWDLCRDWSEEERQYLRDETPKTALDTPFRGRTVLDVSREVLEIAEAGLKRRGQMNGIWRRRDDLFVRA